MNDFKMMVVEAMSQSVLNVPLTYVLSVVLVGLLVWATRKQYKSLEVENHVLTEFALALGLCAVGFGLMLFASL